MPFIKNNLGKIVIGLIALGLALSWEIPMYTQTGSFDPVKHYSAIRKQYRDEGLRKKRYNELYNRLFDLARGDDNAITFLEQVDAWRRMGYENRFRETKGATQFPTPSIEELEKAVASYESK